MWQNNHSSIALFHCCVIFDSSAVNDTKHCGLKYFSTYIVCNNQIVAMTSDLKYGPLISVPSESLQPASTASTLGEHFGLLGSFFAIHAPLPVHKNQQARLLCCSETQDWNTSAARVLNYINYYLEYCLITTKNIKL